MSYVLFSIHNAFRKKAVSALAVFGVACGTALMAFLFSLAAGMEERTVQTFIHLSNRIMVTGKDAIFGGLFLGMGTQPIPLSYSESIRNITHVERVYPQVSAILRPQEINCIMPLYGFSPEEIQESANTPFSRIIEGSASQNDHEIIIGKSLMEYMRFLSYPCQTGGVYRFRIVDKGREEEVSLRISGVYETGNEMLDGAFSASEQLVRKMGKIPDGKVSAINVFVDGAYHVEPVAQEIQSRLSGNVPEVQVVMPGEVLTPVKKILDILGSFLMAVSLVAVLAGGLSIMVIMLLSVINRMKEFGTLKAVGWTPANIITMVLVESLTLSVLGSISGIAIGFGGLLMANSLMDNDIAGLTWRVAFAVLVTGIVIGVAGGIYPAFKAGSAAPAKILRKA